MVAGLRSLVCWMFFKVGYDFATNGKFFLKKLDHFRNKWFFGKLQTSANTSTWYHYSSKFATSCIICVWTWQISPKYSLRPRIEYLYFGQIWRIHVEAKQICSNYSWFWSFMGQIQIIMLMLRSTDLYHRCLGIWRTRFSSTTGV